MLGVALKMLMGDRAKFVGLLFGITFTSFLVTFAASYFCGLMTRGFALIAENGAADVWVTDLSNATIRQLWVRIWRIRLARWAMRACRAFADLAEWLMPEDLRTRL
ncbi:MAG: ABC-type transport system involved in lipoprotein release permease component [Xanthobacteraceae bacterium]|nr:MAG: ABC-type transport system involved in lipoprotein release permease component [Xanthobacteraceae bacterium]